MPRSTKLRLVPVTIKGRPFWQVIAPRSEGKGWTRKTFSRKPDAKRYFEKLQVELLNRGVRGQLSDSVRADVAGAIEILAPFGVSLCDAARAYAQTHARGLRASESVQAAITQFLAAKEKDGARPRYLKDLRVRLGNFARDFSARPIAELSAGEIHDWLQSLGVAALTQNSFWLRLSALWSYAVNRGWASENIVSRVPKAKARAATIGILAPQELARLLSAASAETLPYWLLGAFAGLRSAELERLEWNDVHFDSGLVEVPALKSKTASRRFVTIQPNLALWLAPYANFTGRIAPVNLRAKLGADRERAQLTHWQPNALRHSFASYHLARFENAAALALQLGHTNQDLIFRHYRELVRPAAAAIYWNISPADSKLVTQFDAVA